MTVSQSPLGEAVAFFDLFLKSDWAHRHQHLHLASTWGGSMTTYGATFNTTVLPAVLRWRLVRSAMCAPRRLVPCTK